MACSCNTTTINDHLKGLTSMINVPDDALRAIIYEQGLVWGMPIDSIDEKTLDLTVAHLYLWCVTMMPYSRNNTEDSDGGWKHTEGGYQMITAQYQVMLRRARYLFKKWNEPIPDEFQSGKVTVFNL